MASMRIALALTLLVGISLLAAAWQRGTGLEQDWQAIEPSEQGPGWKRLIMGEPSGAEPLIVNPRGRSMDPPQPGSDPEPQLDPISEPAGDDGFTYWVQPHDTLTQICSRYYTDRRGRSLNELAQLVADHNGLKSPDSIRAGNILVMPSIPSDDSP